METDTEPTLTGKGYVVTGATSGIGYAVAASLCARGASVIGVGRSTERCQAASQTLSALYPQAQVTYLTADLSRQQEVSQLASGILAHLTSHGMDYLEGLLNNAGTFAYGFTLTPDGVELQWAVNHLAPYLLTRSLLPVLTKAPLARVVTVSSASHYGARINWRDPQARRHYNGLRAYGVTKLANILFTLELNRRYQASTSLHAFAADPGLVKTDMGLKGVPPLVQLVWKIRRSGGIAPEEAAKGIEFLLTEPSIQSANDIYWKHGCPRRPDPAALNLTSAARLWALSAELCNLPVEEA